MTTPQNIYGIAPLGDCILVLPSNPPEGPKTLLLESGEIVELPGLKMLERGLVVEVGSLDIPPGITPGATVLFLSTACEVIRGSDLVLLAIEDVSALVKNPPNGGAR